ncbi:MAG: hypothetical protein KDA81_20970, partial [Planctomycetaceae bacterium]|nr:hypothetical protein [Planctomycetaceae bacterium]
MSTDPSSVPSPFDTFAITDVDMLSIPDLHSFRLGDPDEAAELTTETHNATADSDASPTTETDAAP